jgi:hypothetical protein
MLEQAGIHFTDDGAGEIGVDGPGALRPRRDAASRYGAHVGRSPTTTSGASRIKRQYKKVCL